MTTDVRALLRELDDALSRVPEAIPWAERSGNRVDFVDVVDSEADAAGTGLFDLCREIRMADVDAGWFVHPAERRRVGDPYVPVEVEGLGDCAPLGSDGGGRWIVVDDDGRVLHLAEGSIEAGRFRTSTDPAFDVLAQDLDGFLRLMIERASAVDC